MSSIQGKITKSNNKQYPTNYKKQKKLIIRHNKLENQATIRNKMIKINYKR